MNTASQPAPPARPVADYRNALPLPRGFVASLMQGRGMVSPPRAWEMQEPPQDLDQRVRNIGEW